MVKVPYVKLINIVHNVNVRMGIVEILMSNAQFVSNLSCTIENTFINVYFLGDSCVNDNDCPGNLKCLGDYCGCPKHLQQHSAFCIGKSLTSFICQIEFNLICF